MTLHNLPPSGIRGVTEEDCEVSSRERRMKPFSRRMPRNVPLFKCFRPGSGRSRAKRADFDAELEVLIAFGFALFEMVTLNAATVDVDR